MKKKSLNRILFIAVACIWGILLYKFIAPNFSENTAYTMAEVPPAIRLTKVIKKDSIKLTFSDRDPFLGRSVVVNKPQKKAVKKVTKRPTTKLKAIGWPKIEYLGFVKSKKNKDKLGLVRIDGILHRVKQNTEVASLLVKKITDESLVLINGNEERIIAKK